ncbi:MAG: RDD family protein [Gammaproteobacteria bacterium]|nr:RDD family protein [Gammaproteobacteria bacterium]
MQNNSSHQLLLWRRLLAFLYDGLLLIAIFFVITAIAVGLNGGEAITHPFYVLAMYPIAFVFYCWCWQRGGQTLGMQAWRLQLISEQTTKITFVQCLIRFFLGSILFFFTYIGAFFDAKNRPIHDQLSRTKIVLKSIR